MKKKKSNFVLVLQVIIISLLLPKISAQKFRADGKCGKENLDSDGNPAICDNIPPFPTCCQKNGHCGWDCDHISSGPGASVASGPAVTTPKPVYSSNGRYRSDGRCGEGFYLEDGVTPAECDPNSDYFCCSNNNYCGGTQDHCYCDTCVNFRPLKIDGKVRSDRRCGAKFPLEDGTPSECNGKSVNPCCSVHGYCGPGDAHCSCIGCVDYRSGSPVVQELFVGKVRADRRCGSQYPLPDGTASECDPNSPNPCCSKWGYCGPGSDHCDCPDCKDYRSVEKKREDFIGNVRKDRRCGKDFPLPGSDKPSECDPESSNYCCSKWGFCGGDGEHCDCPECVNYKNL